MVNDVKYEIIFEDEWFIIINKQGYYPVQGDKKGTPSLLKDLSLHRDVFLTHRLDQPVTGVIVFAKSESALKDFNKLLQKGALIKKYWAVVTSDPGQEAHLVHYLLKDGRKNLSRIGKADQKGAKKASLTYRLLVTTDRYWGIEITLHTGRHHQIRTQMKANGTPIKGDLKYGAKRSNPGGGISLHARYLEFSHPFTGETLKITAPVPFGSDGKADPLWSSFSL